MSNVTMESSLFALKPAWLLVSTYSTSLMMNRISLDEPTKTPSHQYRATVNFCVWNVGLGADCGSGKNLSLNCRV
jgi:hypothetical protein